MGAAKHDRLAVQQSIGPYSCGWHDAGDGWLKLHRWADLAALDPGDETGNGAVIESEDLGYTEHSPS